MKINTKLVHILIVSIIMYLFIQTLSFWGPVINKLLSILIPILISFTIAYALHPFVKYLQKKKVNKSISLVIVLSIFLAIIGTILFLAIPLLYNQIISLFNSIISFMIEISNNYDISLGSLQQTLTDSFNTIVLNLGKYISNGAINVIGTSFGYISNIIIIFAASIYFLIDMDEIRNEIKSKLKKKTYLYVKALDNTMKTYLTGYAKIAIISFIEYSLAFTIIGHPNALLLGLLISVLELVPYFGGLFTNIVALVTAFVISPGLFIRTIIVFLVLSVIDSYVINPLVYGKTNKIHPLVVILAVFIGGALFGVLGIIVALPISLMLITTYNYYKEDISDTFSEIKNNLD